MECLENSKVASVMLMELNMIWFSSGLDSSGKVASARLQVAKC